MPGAPVIELEYLHDIQCRTRRGEYGDILAKLGWYHEYNNLVPETSGLGGGIFLLYQKHDGCSR